METGEDKLGDEDGVLFDLSFFGCDFKAKLASLRIEEVDSLIM